MYIIKQPDQLIHYGVKGMKWGVRKDGKPSRGRKIAKAVGKKARSTRNYYRNYTGSRKSAALKKYRGKNIDGMSDKDLQKAVQRLNLEKQYRSLTKADFYRGKRIVDTMYNNQMAMNKAVSSYEQGKESAKKAKTLAVAYGVKKAAQLAAL